MKGRRCLLTGAGGGIGNATARRLCEEGAAVVLADVSAEQVSDLAEQLEQGGCAAHALALDVTDEAAVRSAVDQAARVLGGLDGLIANAGILTTGRIEDLSAEAFRQTLEVNLVGAFLCARAAIP
ncbi:SDR family NAD(P)-dependent oxidoreductase, partial [Klebsiella variicola]|uniref:SDR family NAD(P)-dependent oxidoreductase n=1 Tax=Klebsiella variicola TaxID=244366 RepID=UPI000E203987